MGPQGLHGLGIMIIEGKHAEVGQGIFISDIQENSAAEQVSRLLSIVQNCWHLHWMNQLCCQQLVHEKLLHVIPCVCCAMYMVLIFVRDVTTFNCKFVNCLSTDEWYHAQELVFIRLRGKSLHFSVEEFQKIVIFQIIVLFVYVFSIINANIGLTHSCLCFL